VKLRNVNFRFAFNPLNAE